MMFRNASILKFNVIPRLFANCSVPTKLFCTKPSENEEATASFGFKTVRESEKADKGSRNGSEIQSFFFFAENIFIYFSLVLFLRSSQSIRRCGIII